MILFSQDTQFNEYFNSSEFDSPDVRFSGNNMKSQVITLLYRLRVLMNESVIISSGVRSIPHNTDIGGSPDSSHITFLAVDIKIKNIAYRYKLIKYLLMLGVKRIGVYENHIHIDLDLSKTQNIMWYVK